ncbi:LacI family DNA-binding transcriptional regulator [Arcanobacterium phocae]|uniref:LacI family DNA-binding transcriptional regulator n=1 Tax=Arcanobacterium phocae TaxID=131112 RepID=UPI001C0E91FB|nr:LacI family DNA-binding transcriptional regulator [Arcanobacterium phocae]
MTTKKSAAITRRATMRDVAEHIGLSVSTVSLALRNDPRISDKTAQEIKRVAREIGYRPDITGSLLRTNNPRIIGVAAEFSQELHAAYVSNIRSIANKHGYQLAIEDASFYAGYEEALERLAQLRVTNTIAINPCFPEPIPERLEPSVIIGQTSPCPTSSLVRSSNDVGMQELVTHLVDRGYRRILYLDGPKGISARNRRRAIEHAANVNDVWLEIVAAGNSLDDGFLAMQHVLCERSDSPTNQFKEKGIATAVVGYNDQCIQGAVIALERAGLRIPLDVAVAGFDNSSIAASRAFGLTSVDRGIAQVSEYAVELAIERHNNTKIGAKTLVVDSHLVVRNTTTPVA